MVHIIKRRDYFGHTINMNFDDKIPTHNTIIGGLASMALNMVVLALVVAKVLRVVNNDNPDMNSIISPNVLGLQVDVNYTTMNAFTFHALKKQSIGWLRLDYPELDRYMSFYFEQKHVNWYEFTGPGTHEKTVFSWPAEPCTVEHFGDTEQGKYYFNIWNGGTIVCLPIEARNKVQIRGDLSENIVKNLIFKVDKCQNSTRKPD